MPPLTRQRPLREGDLQTCTGTCGRVTRPNGVLIATCPPNTVIRNKAGKCWVCADPRGRTGTGPIRRGRPRRLQTEEAKEAMLAEPATLPALEVDESELTEKERYVLAGARAFTNARRERLARLRRRVNA